LQPRAEGVAEVQVMLCLQSVPEYLQASRAAVFAFSSLPRLLNMKVCRGLTSCMAETRSSDALAVPSMMCNTAASTVLADVCTLIGCNTDIIYHSSHGAARLNQDHAKQNCSIGLGTSNITHQATAIEIRFWLINWAVDRALAQRCMANNGRVQMSDMDEGMI